MSKARPILCDEHGKELPLDRLALIRLAFDTFMKMTEHERGLVLCWFCSACHRYVGPGDACHCSNDE